LHIRSGALRRRARRSPRIAPGASRGRRLLLARRTDVLNPRWHISLRYQKQPVCRAASGVAAHSCDCEAAGDGGDPDVAPVGAVWLGVVAIRAGLLELDDHLDAVMVIVEIFSGPLSNPYVRVASEHLRGIPKCHDRLPASRPGAGAWPARRHP